MLGEPTCECGLENASFRALNAGVVDYTAIKLMQTSVWYTTIRVRASADTSERPNFNKNRASEM